MTHPGTSRSIELSSTIQWHQLLCTHGFIPVQGNTTEIKFTVFRAPSGRGKESKKSKYQMQRCKQMVFIFQQLGWLYQLPEPSVLTNSWRWYLRPAHCLADGLKGCSWRAVLGQPCHTAPGLSSAGGLSPGTTFLCKTFDAAQVWNTRGAEQPGGQCIWMFSQLLTRRSQGLMDHEWSPADILPLLRP